ncbi:MAG: hypothetical protein AAF922_05610 [Pseudomonadota bacterium]
MIEATEAATFLQSNWAWASGLGAAMLSLTWIGVLLNPARRDDLALWLLGAHTETWHPSFTRLFDAVFGAHHLSFRCFLRSALASLLAVCLIWLMMGSAETIGLRLQSDLGLGAVLVIGLAINVLADYLSLLETRWLLSRMPRPWWAQAGVLLLDLTLTAAIIWIAIFAYIRSPLHEGEIDSFAEILGVFSIFSVFFYSTFLTSIWTWAYIASTWVMRVVTAIRVDFWFDVEGKPFFTFLSVLACCVGGVTFAGSMLVGLALGHRQDGVTALDRTLCTVFQGRVCEHVANLTPNEQAQLDFITRACEGGVTEECLDRALAIYEVDAATAARLWRASCNGGDAVGCTNLGYLHNLGIGMEADPVEAARLYRQGCDGGDAAGCTNLGYLHLEGIGVDPEPFEAARLFRQACDEGDALGCNNLGFLHVEGIEVDRDPVEAARLFRQACDKGDKRGCNNLGYLYEQGIGIAADPEEAARLFRQACEMGLEESCGWAEDLENP